MAQILLEELKFVCSICRDLMKSPASVPCGHSYCQSCIERCWDEAGQKKRVKCPQCKQSFMPRPVLYKNNELAEVVATLERTALESALPDHMYAGPAEVSCDSCIPTLHKKKLKAVETCLQCLVNYCDTHVEPHRRSPAFKDHTLVKVSSKLHGDIAIQQKVQEMEEEVLVLHHEVEAINRSADRAATSSDAIFAELIASLERRRWEVREHIRDQQRQELSRAAQQRKRVELAVAEQRRRHAEMGTLSSPEDALQVNHSSSSLSRISESTRPVELHEHTQRYFDEVALVATKMKGKLEAVLKEEGARVTDAVNTADVLLSTPEPTTRAEFLKYALAVTLDPNTHHNYLVMNAGNLKVTNTNVVQHHPDHPDRFSECWQCLGTEALSGRHYWEVEWGGDYVDIAVAYPDAERSGKMERRFGLTLKTWCLQCWGEACFFRHGKTGIEVPIPVRSRVGVYLDHPAGIVSWYSVSDTMTLLKRVHTIFTRPIYPGFWVCDGATMEMCHDIKFVDPLLGSK